MPLSGDPAAREAQLANLPNLRGERTAATWKPGDAPNLRHGLKTESPAPAVIDPVIAELSAALPLRDADGEVPLADRRTVWLTSRALIRVERCERYLAEHGDTDEHGVMRPEFDMLGRAIEHAAKLLDRLGLSPRSRAAMGLDLVKTMSAGAALTDHVRRNYSDPPEATE